MVEPGGPKPCADRKHKSEPPAAAPAHMAASSGIQHQQQHQQQHRSVLEQAELILRRKDMKRQRFPKES